MGAGGHENEAPFPVEISETFLLSFSPPVGTVLELLCRFGMTSVVAGKNPRFTIGIDVPHAIHLVENRLRRYHLS